MDVIELITIEEEEEKKKEKRRRKKERKMCIAPLFQTRWETRVL